MQFVAVARSGGYSVEAQIIGLDRRGGMQLEIIPPKLRWKGAGPVPTPTMIIFVHLTSQKRFALPVFPDHTWLQVKSMVETREGTTLDYP